MTRKVLCGGVAIGGGAQVSIQSMTNIPNTKEDEVLEQIRRLENAGCQIVRLAVNTPEAAEGFARIRRKTQLPMVADIHFDYRLALAAIDGGADKIRINPGNIGSRDRVETVVRAAKSAGIPIRVGVNSGSLEKDILAAYGRPCAEALAESALRNVRILEEMDFEDIVISLKSSDVVTNTKAYRIVSERCDYPLHIGVTEAGTLASGIVKSAMGIGALLIDGIGDTMRVSLTADPVEEVYAAKRILKGLKLMESSINVVSCPTCGRTRVNLEALVADVEARLAPLEALRIKEDRRGITVAVMGCEVNGPGEAADADIGVACGSGEGVIFARGQLLRKVPEGEIAAELARLCESLE